MSLKKCLKKLVEVIEKDNTIGTVVPKFVNFYSRNIESSGTWVSRAFYNGHYADKGEKQKLKEMTLKCFCLVLDLFVAPLGPAIWDPSGAEAKI